MMRLESHISHHKNSHRVIDNQLQCRKHRGCLASQVGRHKCPCVSQVCTLPCCHILSVDRGQHIHLTCKFCQMDSHHLFGIVLVKKKEEINICLKWPRCLKNFSTYIESILDVDFLPSFRGICTLECDWMFCRWHSCHKGLSHMGQYSSVLHRPCHLYIHRHADILLSEL